MKKASQMKIVVSEDGPYIVSGNVPLSIQIITPNKEDESWDWKEAKTFDPKDRYKLCRCGQSKAKPFCDDSHARVGFDGTEAATRLTHASEAKLYDGPTLALSDAEGLCAYARFCHPGGKVWRLVAHSNDAEARKLAIREASHCPSGRLVLHDKKTGHAIEPELPPSIGLVEDPVLGCSGPLWVRGGITIESADGTPYEVRNRVTLCRCGASANKPFCDGSHDSVRFTDGLVEYAKQKPGEGQTD